MDDNDLRKEKYRCEFDGPDGVTISDLIIKGINPEHNRPVRVKKGEYILTELLDFADLKKSRTSGALGKFIELKWISVEDTTTVRLERTSRTMPDGVTELQAGLIDAKDITDYAPSIKEPLKSLGYPRENHPKVVESLPLEVSRGVNSLAISEAVIVESAETAYNQFDSLRYFQKLKTIKETADIALLEMIAARSNYPQLIHNAKNKLRDLRKGR